MLSFVKKATVQDAESAARIYSQYLNRDVDLSVDFNSIPVSLLDAQADDGVLYLKFSWQAEDIGNDYRIIRSKLGKEVRVRINSEEMVGVLGTTTEIPPGADMDTYKNSPFVLAMTFPSSKFASFKGSIIGIDVPSNIRDLLPIADDLEYDPHITVAFFPNLSTEDIPLVLRAAKEAAKKVGSFSVRVTQSKTFPTPDEEGNYPHVALIESDELRFMHEEIVRVLEHYSPGLVSTDFVGKNYNPHITLKYSKNPSSYSPIKELKWSVDSMFLSYRGGDEFFPIPLSGEKRASGGGSIQVGDVTIPVMSVNDNDNIIQINLERGKHSDLVSTCEGQQVTLSTSSYNKKIQILEVSEEGPDRFSLSYRPLVTYMSKKSRYLLIKVSNLLELRGFTALSKRVASLLDFSPEESESEGTEEEEPEDVDALGPGFPGTDPRIVTYVKAPQTTQTIDEPKFPMTLPLHERI